MITQVIAAAARDVLDIVDGGSFFEETEKTRTSRVDRQLGKSYPQSLREYTSSVSGSQFVTDFQSLLPMFATGSVIAYGRKASKHRFLKATALALKEMWASGDVPENTNLGNALKGWLAEGNDMHVGRIMTREAQHFVELVLQEDSPHIQIAETLQKSVTAHFQKLYGGLPSFLVSRQLLGGSRLFVKGKIIDASWRAKVQRFLSALR